MPASPELGYSYHNPASPTIILGDFDVLLTHPTADDLHQVAKDHQEIMRDTWVEQFAGKLTTRQIEKTVNPDNPELVEAQEARLLDANVPGKPTYVHARINMPGVLTPIFCTAGIGKTKYADGRPRHEREASADPSAANNLADVGDIFVRPRWERLGGLPLQGHGLGPAMLHCMLDAYPDDMDTLFYDFAFNGRIVPLVKRVGFRAVQAKRIKQFGTRVTEIQFDGPPAGELRENIEGLYPWFTHRQPLAA